MPFVEAVARDTAPKYGCIEKCLAVDYQLHRYRIARLKMFLMLSGLRCDFGGTDVRNGRF